MSNPKRDTPPAPSRLHHLEQLLQYSFQDQKLIQRALTHRSFAHESGISDSRETPQDYEGLEFLGDAILDFVISEYLFRNYPAHSEGELSRMRAYLVSAKHLAPLSEKLSLGDWTRLSQGEEKTGGREKKAILADLFESVVAAIYLDGGLPAARRFILDQFHLSLERMARQEINFQDHKSRLQELLHRKGLAEPSYRTVSEAGPDHRKEFTVELAIEGKTPVQARGRSKKEAHQKAARQVLQALEDAPESSSTPP